MHPADFCEHYIKAFLSFIFLSNSTLALLLGIPYIEQRHDRVLGQDQLVFGQGEVVQIITSSIIVVSVFCLFLCRIIPSCRFRVPNIVASVALAALSALGASCLTTFDGGNAHCETDGFQNTKCYRRPDIDLPLTWFSTAIALTGVLASLILHLCDDPARTWPRPDNDRALQLAQPAIRDSLELARTRGCSDRSDSEENRRGVGVDSPPPPYKPPHALLSSRLLPSVPLRKRDMNKLGLTVITDIPMDSPFDLRPLDTIPTERWRGRGRDVWEKKPLGPQSELPERV